MNLWLVASAALSPTLLLCAWMCLRGAPEWRFVGLQLTGTLLCLLLVMLTMGFGRMPFIDLAVALAILAFGSGLVYARFLEKHL